MNSEKKLPNPDVRLFSNQDEFLFLSIPIFFLILSLFSILYHFNFYPSNFTHDLMHFIILIFGLQAAHNAFTFSIAYLPEVQKWLDDQKSDNHINYRRQWLVIAGAVFLIWILYFFTKNNGSFYNYKILGRFKVNALFWIVIALITYWHNFRQYYGLSALYNQHYEFAQPYSFGLNINKKTLKIERLLFTTLCFTSTNFISFLIHYGLSPILLSVFVASTTIVISAIFINDFSYPVGLRRPKILFHGRLPLILLFPFSPFAGIGMNFCHNFEYWLIYKKIITNSAISKRTPNRYILLSVLGISCVVLISSLRLSLHDHWRSSFAEPFRMVAQNHPNLCSILLATSFTITTIHYFLDADLFHFRDPLTRKHIGVLLFKAENATPKMSSAIDAPFH